MKQSAAAYWPEQEGQLKIHAQYAHAQVAFREGHRALRAKHDPVVNPAGLTQGNLGIGTAIEIVKYDSRNTALGNLPQVRNV
jgi:hypothetical protein